MIFRSKKVTLQDKFENGQNLSFKLFKIRETFLLFKMIDNPIIFSAQL